LKNRIKNTVLYQEASSESNKGLRNIVFYAPVRGVITEKFNSNTGHYGVDIAAANNTGVKAVLDGTVFWPIGISVQESDYPPT